MPAANALAFLTAEDAAVLQILLQDPALTDTEKATIFRKLDTARIIDGGRVPADVATINSRITYQVSGGVPVSAFLVNIRKPFRSFQGVIPLRGLGLSLLGMREGSRAQIALPGDAAAELVLKRVLYQPQRVGTDVFGGVAQKTKAHPAPRLRPRLDQRTVQSAAGGEQ
jgi:hypothetical protein